MIVFFNPCITTYLNIRVRRSRLLVSSDRWKYNLSLGRIVFIYSRKPCLFHVYLHGVFAHLSMFVLDMQVLYVVLMYHQQGMSFPNMLSVQHICFSSIEQHGKYNFSREQIFQSNYLMVSLIHNCLCSRLKVDDAFLMRFFNSTIPDSRASNISTNSVVNISAATPTILVFPRRRTFC